MATKQSLRALEQSYLQNKQKKHAGLDALDKKSPQSGYTNQVAKKKKRKISPEAQLLIDTYLKPAQDKRVKDAESGAIKTRDTQDKNIAQSRKDDQREFDRNRKAALLRDATLARQKSKLDYKGVPHTEVDRSVNFTDSTIPGMPMTANVTEAVTAKGPKKPTRDENIARVAALNKEISKLASLKTASEADAAKMSDEDKQYYTDINASKRAHIANLIAEKNQLEQQIGVGDKKETIVKPKDDNKPKVNNEPKVDNEPKDVAKNDQFKLDMDAIKNLATENPDSLDVLLSKAGIEPAMLDSVIASSKRLAEKNQAKKNPENWSLNKKTRFRRAWRAKHAKDLNSRDPKVSTPIRLTLQQLENWEKGNGPFPESLKNELK